MKIKSLLYIIILSTLPLGFWAASSLAFETNINAYNLASDEELAAYDSFIRELSPPTGTESIIVLEKDSGWNTLVDFQQLQKITEFWEAQSEIETVTSITNLRYPKRGFFLPLPTSEPFLNLVNIKRFQKRMDQLDSYTDIASKFLSKDQRYTLLFVHAPAGIAKTSAQRLAAIDILKPDTQIHYIQYDLIQKELESVLREDTIVLASISLCLILLGFYLFTKSLRGIGLIGLMIAFNIALTFIAMYSLSMQFTVHMVTIPCIITVLSFTDIMHILYYQQREHADSETAVALRSKIRSSVRVPLLLTSLTNIVGFLIFLIFAENIHLFHFSLAAIIGVAIAYFSSRFLVIRLMDKEPIFIQRSSFQQLHQFHHRISQWFWRNRHFILPLFVVTTVFLMVQVGTNLTIDSSEQEYALSGSSLARGQAILQAEFFGSKQAEVFINLKRGSLWNISTLNQLEEIEEELRKTFDPLFINGPGTVVKRYNRYLKNGHRRAFVIPERIDANFVTQLQQHAGRLGGNGIIDSTATKARIVFGFGKMKLPEARQHFENLRTFLSEKNTPDLQLKLSGLQYLSDEATHRFSMKILMGLLFSILFGSVLVWVFLQSFRKSIGVLLVNLFPLIFALGIMLCAELPITPLTLFFLSILLGICVDDSIYLITQKTLDSRVVHLVPIFITSFVLSFGFLSLACSSFAWIQPFGWIFLVGIWLAYVLDIFVLPLFLWRS